MLHHLNWIWFKNWAVFIHFYWRSLTAWCRRPETSPTPGTTTPPGRFGGTTGGLRPPTWTFAGHQPPSYQTYSDVKPISRKPSIKSTTLEGQTLDLSFPGHVYKQNTKFSGNSIFSSLAKLHHTLGIKSCMSRDGFYMVLDRFWQV